MHVTTTFDVVKGSLVFGIHSSEQKHPITFHLQLKPIYCTYGFAPMQVSSQALSAKFDVLKSIHWIASNATDNSTNNYYLGARFTLCRGLPQKTAHRGARPEPPLTPFEFIERSPRQPPTPTHPPRPIPPASWSGATCGELMEAVNINF